MPNPSTVYASEFDPAEQAGGGPPEKDGDGSYGTLVFGPDHEICGRTDGLADGLPGGSNDDFSAFDLDTQSSSVEDINLAGDIIKTLRRLECECQKLEANWECLKKECKEALVAFEASQECLRAYVRGLTEPLPLFDGVSNDSPAGDIDLPVGVVAQPCGHQDKEPGRPDVSDDAHGSPEEAVTGGAERVSEDGASSDEAGDKSWEGVELRRVFPPGIAAKLAAARLFTVGQLAEFRGRGHLYISIPGIGNSKAAVMIKCMEAFWQKLESSK